MTLNLIQTYEKRVLNGLTVGEDVVKEDMEGGEVSGYLFGHLPRIRHYEAAEEDLGCMIGEEWGMWSTSVQKAPMR